MVRIKKMKGTNTWTYLITGSDIVWNDKKMNALKKKTDESLQYARRPSQQTDSKNKLDNLQKTTLRPHS